MLSMTGLCSAFQGLRGGKPQAGLSKPLAFIRYTLANYHVIYDFIR